MEATVICPYCAEAVDVYFEDDVHGELVQDCEVCCNPWLLHVSHEGGALRVEAQRAQ